MPFQYIQTLHNITQPLKIYLNQIIFKTSNRRWFHNSIRKTIPNVHNSATKKYFRTSQRQL